jgi:hypothetical protein
MTRDAAKTKRDILEVMNTAYDKEPEKYRKLCMLKARLFDYGFTVFDVLGFSDQKWLEIGLDGKMNTFMVGGMVTIRQGDKPAGQPGGSHSGHASGHGRGSGSRSDSRGGDGRGSDHGRGSGSASGSGRGGGGGGGDAGAGWRVGRAEARGGAKQPPESALPIGARMPPPDPARVMRPPEIDCKHHGMPRPELWHHEPLRMHEIEATETDDGVWSTQMIKNTMCSLQATHSVPHAHAHLWNILELPNYFWEGNPLSRDMSKFFVRGWWRAAKATRSIQFGCLRCGYRTPVIYLNQPRTRDMISGQEQITHVLKMLFE